MGQDTGEAASLSQLLAETEAPLPLGRPDPARAVEAQPTLNSGPPGDKPSTPSAASASLGTRGSAGDFTPEGVLRAPTGEPRSGWRSGVRLLTAGLVRPGPSTAERRHRDLVARVKTPIRGCRKVAFISRKGGVGKTSTCLLAGHTFATYRGDRVIALDGNPDAGTLGHRLRRETTATVTTLLTDENKIERYSDIRGYTTQAPTRLEVLAADDDPQTTEALGEDEMRRAIRLLERHYNLVCLDTGAGVLDSATRGILGEADQIVVVAPASLDGARAASSTLDWLDENGYGHLVAGAVAVINGVRPAKSLVDLGRVEDHFAGRCRATVRVPWDRHLETGAEAAMEALRPGTRRAYLELAAEIAAGFSEPTGRR